MKIIWVVNRSSEGEVKHVDMTREDEKAANFNVGDVISATVEGNLRQLKLKSKAEVTEDQAIYLYFEDVTGRV